MALNCVFCLAACRYEKGTWSTCSAQNEMVRTDTIKDKSDSSCEQTRQITKKCKSKGARTAKGGKSIENDLENIIIKKLILRRIFKHSIFI